MGYILPITNFQSQDYHNRVIKSELDPYYIEHPYKVVLDTKSREMDDRENTQKYAKPLKSTYYYHPIQTENPKSEKLYAKLTGKGRHFSESI